MIGDGIEDGKSLAFPTLLENGRAGGYWNLQPDRYERYALPGKAGKH
jgi:hypothetical protein